MKQILISLIQRWPIEGISPRAEKTINKHFLCRAPCVASAGAASAEDRPACVDRLKGDSDVAE
jgi:hypothetical protein